MVVNSNWVLSTNVNHIVLSGSHLWSRIHKKCNFGTRTSSPRTDVMHSWAWYGQVSNPDDIDVFLDNVAWAICSTNHIVLKVSPCTAIFGCNMLFDIPFVAKWNKIGNFRWRQTNFNTTCKNRIMNTRLAMRFWWKKIVSSAKQKAQTAKCHGLSQKN